MTFRLPSARIILLTFLAFACVSVPAALAASEFVPLAGIPGLTEGVKATEGGIADFLGNLYLFAIGAAVMLAVIMIIWGGLEYSLSESITSKGAGKSKIYNALFGLVLVLSPALVFTIINPAILNLNVNMPKLETKQGTSGSIGGEPVTTTNNGDFAASTIVKGVTPCTDNATCSKLVTECNVAAPTNAPSGYTGSASVGCIKSGAFDVNSRTDWYLPFSTYACPAGTELAVRCAYSKVQKK